MSVANEAHAGGIAAAPDRAAAAPKPDAKPQFWQQRAFYRYGFLILMLAIWEWLGPLVNPILFSHPSKIAVAFYELTISGELPYYAMESLEILFCGLFFAIVVGVPLGAGLGRWLWDQFALDISAVPRPTVPMGAILAVVVAAIVVANVAAAIPARLARQVRPATILATE